MKEEIRRIITQINADRENIDIISARDIGSHAWGLANDESDYDVGVVYTEIRNPNTINTEQEILKLGSYTDTEKIELKAWSLKKFAKMLSDSNSSALLYSQSDIQYIDEPTEFTQLAEYGRENFRPANAIGQHMGKAKNNFWKYLKPTIIRQEDKKEHEFNVVEYEPQDAEDDGMITLQPTDNQDADTETIHPTHIGDNNWKLIHRETENHRWKIITEYNNPKELTEKTTLIVEHPENNTQKVIRVEEIAPDDAEKGGDWEWRWGTNDRTKKRYVYVCESLIRADIIACTQEYPSANFNTLLNRYEELTNPYTTIPTDSLREFADDKRSGSGYDYTIVPHENDIQNSISSIKDAFADPENHRDDLSIEKINEFIRGITE